MNKIFAFIFMCVSCVAAFAQLPTVFENCTLGKSTPTEVMRVFSQKGFNPQINDVGSIFVSIINAEHPIDKSIHKYCGTWWQSCYFNFENGVTQQILLQNIYNDIRFAKIYYNIVNDYLKENHSRYYWKPISPVSKSGYSEIEGVYYNSGKTYFKLFYGESEGYPVVCLDMYYR